MDAVTPLRRWMFAVVLAASIGCVSNGVSGGMSARGQMPADPVLPLPPANPVSPGSSGSPNMPIPQQPPVGVVVPGQPVSPLPAGNVGVIVPGQPVSGQPVSPGSADPANAGVQQAVGYSNLQNIAKSVDHLKDGIPQIKVVALVGATGLVTDQEVVEAMRQRPELGGLEGHALRAKEKELYAMMLRKLIERELILDEMYARLKKANKTTVIDDIKEYAGKAADQNLRSIRKELKLDTEEKFQMWLRAQGLTEPVIRRQIERQMMADEYIHSALKEKGRIPGLADIRLYYDQHPDEFKSEDKVKWQDIFISVNKHPSLQAARTHAEQVLREASGGADFISLVKAQETPEVAARRKNWDGIGTRRGEVPTDVAATVWALQTGQISGIIETTAGYHIVKVVEREYAGLRPLDSKVQGEVRQKLVKHYRDVEERKMIEDLWRHAVVRVIDNP
jgi:parvulin-like peptidyl-prolyl isomerase